MRKYYFIIPLLLFLAPFFHSCSGDDWKTSEHASFTVKFPGTPKDTVTQDGQFTGSKIFYEPGDGSLDSNLYYAVSWYELPDSLSSLGNKTNDVLRTDVQIYAWSIDGNLLNDGQPVKNDDTQGMEYKVTLSGNAGMATVRKYILGKQLYTLIVLTDNDHLNNGSIGHFMNSFHLKKK